MSFLNSLGVGQWQHIDKLKKNQKPVCVPGTVLVLLTYNDFKEITTTLCSSSTCIIFYRRRNWSWMGHEKVPQQSKNSKFCETLRTHPSLESFQISRWVQGRGGVREKCQEPLEPTSRTLVSWDPCLPGKFPFCSPVSALFSLWLPRIDLSYPFLAKNRSSCWALPRALIKQLLSL